MVGEYKVITLCGSTRFKNEFMEVQKRLTLEGNIVISVGLFGHSGDNEVWENMDEHISVSFGELLLRLFQKTGQIEASFVSKMPASIDPDQPIWDSMVLKNLNLKLRGKSSEIRLSRNMR